MNGIEGFTLGRYELRRRVAQGGMAEVYLAYDRRVRRQVAIKVLYGRNEPFVRRFEREALAVGALSHDHILPLYDFGEQRPWYYLVMPYIEGGTLRDYLLKRKRLTLEESASFIDQIASALQHAHAHGVVHRDVKPSNILLRPDGYAYLVDFGLAKAMLGAECLTSAGAMVGTPEYMAPEQSNGLNDYRSDIYSLGVILYQMLTGRVPFTAESPVAVSLKHIQAVPPFPRTLNPEIPQSVEEVILKAMAKDVSDRYQEAQEFSQAYWKALQVGQAQAESQVKVELSSSSPASGVAQTIADEPFTTLSLDEQTKQLPSAITRVLPESAQNAFHPPLSPLLFPLDRDKGLKAESADGTVQVSRQREIRKKSSGNLRSILLAVTCLLLLLLTLPFAFGVTWQRQPQHYTITPVTNAQSVVVQQPGRGDAHLTATALAQATTQALLAAQARVQATAGITSAIGAGSVLYADDMTTSGGGWIDDGSQCFFSPEGYHVRTFFTHAAAWCYSSQQRFSNVVITAQAQLLHGDVYGLIFRLSPTSRSFYVLEINSQGEYRFVRAAGSNPLNWLTLVDWTYSDAIAPGYSHTNTFLVIASGSQFRIYMNKQLILTDFSDSAYAVGMIGFLVGGDNSGGAEAVFSNVWVCDVPPR